MAGMHQEDKPAGGVLEGLLRLHGCQPGEPLRIGGIDARELAREHGTPTYVYDAGLLRSRYEAVETALGVEVLYAIKANPNLAVSAVLRAAGAGAEVASAGELLVADRAGFAPQRVQFAGPGKSLADLTLALRQGIHSINLESPSEYDQLAGLARLERLRPGVAIRVNPKEGVGGSRMRMSGGSRKFGVDEEAVAELITRIHSEDLVDLHGLHCYMGTQCFDAEAWLDSARWLLAFAQEMESRTGVALPSLDFGGGFAVPCHEGDAEFDLQLAGEGMRRLLADEDRKAFVELGRYLVAPAGVFLTQVLHIKQSQGRRFAILDGGMHQHAAAAGQGSVLRRPYPIVAVRDPRAEDTRPQSLCGPLCTPADDFVSDLSLPTLAKGDIVAILASGAYGLTFSNLRFLSHPSPAEVLVDASRSWLVRRRGRPEDALDGQVLPPLD